MGVYQIPSSVGNEILAKNKLESSEIRRGAVGLELNRKVEQLLILFDPCLIGEICCILPNLTTEKWNFYQN